MSITLVKYEWDLGNGTTSSAISPTTLYKPGKYRVILRATDDTGTVYVVDKPDYIIVSEDDQSLDNFDYIYNYNSLHYGWKDEHGFGWSKNERPTWVLPFTSESVYNHEEDGKIYTIVWDGLTNKPYIINTQESYEEEAVYTDKADVGGLNGTEFSTEIVFPEFTGEMTHYDLSHLETNVMFRPTILKDDFTGTWSVDFTLIANNREDPVETQFNQDVDSEILFYYQNDKTKNSRTKQLKVTTSTSDYQLMNYESYYKVNDRFKRAASGSPDSAMVFFGNVVDWWTRGKGYNYNRASGATSADAFTSIAGPDGKSGSAVNTDEVFTNFSTTADIQNKIITVMSTSDLTVSGYTALGTKDTWTLYYKLEASSTQSIGFGQDIDLFDLRVLNTNDTASLTTAAVEYLDKLDFYLPAYL